MSNKSLININSKNRIVSGDRTTNFSVSIDSEIIQRVSGIRIKSVSFCNCLYNINPTNNNFVYEDSLGYHSVTVPSGQYNLSQLLTTLEALLLAQPNSITAVFVVDALTKKISATSAPNISFFDFDGIFENTLGISLGIVGNTGLTGATTFTNFPDIGGLNVLNIVSEKLSNESGYMKQRTYNNGIIQRSILNGFVYSIPVESSFGFPEIYENQDSSDIIRYKSPRNLSTVDIRLVDDQNFEIDLQGTHFNLVLEVYYD